MCDLRIELSLANDKGLELGSGIKKDIGCDFDLRALMYIMSTSLS